MIVLLLLVLLMIDHDTVEDMNLIMTFEHVPGWSVLFEKKRATWIIHP
jgi:hypothetical protein